MKRNHIDVLEKQLYKDVRKYSSADILELTCAASKWADDPTKQVGADFRRFEKKWHPMVGAYLAKSALQWSNPHRPKPSVNEFMDLYGKVSDFVTRDPLTFDSSVHAAFEEDYSSFFLRMAGQQFRFFRSDVLNIPRAKLLWGQAVTRAESKKDFPKVNVDNHFLDLTGGTIEDLLDAGFLIFAAATGSATRFNSEYFQIARRRGIRLPNERVLSKIIGFLGATQKEFRELAKSLQLLDRRFRVYDPNPLHWKPLIRSGTLDDQFTAPIPNLVAAKISDGAYYEAVRMKNNAFLEAFGHVFEEYIGILLEHSLPLGCEILRERDVRGYRYTGKVPDFTVVSGKKAFLFESKACRMPINYLAGDNNTAFFDIGLKQVRTGLTQLAEFTEAIQTSRANIPILENVTEVTPVLVTFEPIYFINQSFVQEKLAKYWTEALPRWHCLSMSEVEAMQPHVARGVCFSEAISAYCQADGLEAGNRLGKISGVDRQDSLLAVMLKDMFSELHLDRTPTLKDS